MKNFRWWPAFGLTAVAVALTGCGSGNSDSASVRLANATLTHPSLDFLVNGSVASTADASDAVTGYNTPSSGSVTLQVNDSGSATSLAASTPTLTSSDHYTLVAYESGGVVKTALLGEDATLPAAGVTTLRLYDAAIEAGPLDVYIVAAGTNACSAASLASVSPITTFGSLTAPAAVSLTQGAGTWDVCATAANNKADLRMTFPVTLVGATVATVLMTPASGGALLNGSMLTQQGAYAAVRNTNSRVRLAAAVSGGATVAATATSSGNNYTIDAGSVAPAYDFSYTLVPAGSSLSASVNGSSVVAPTGTLAVGSDYTLLVYGSPTAPTTTLLSDNNRQPTVSTTSSIRLINGVTGAVGNLTLTLGTTPIGIAVAPGTASAYTTASISTTATSQTLSLSSSNSALVTNLVTTLNQNTVYSVLAGGDASAPVLLIR